MRYIKLFEDYEEDEKQLIDYLISLYKENRRMKANMRKVRHFIVDKGVDINAYNGNYGTLLCLSVYIGDLTLTKYLIKKGANLDLTNSIKSSPVYIAASLGYFDILVYLVEHRANIDLSNDSRVSPLMAAALKKNFDCAIYLLNKGADISYFFKVFNQDIYNKNYKFQKAFIEKYPDEFVENMKEENVRKDIMQEYSYLFMAKKYNL